MKTADDVSKAYHEGYEQGRFDAIADIPHGIEKGYSVVAVVRCGECRHGKVSDECFGLDGTPLIQCQYCTLPNQPFEYCSWGEKMDKEDDHVR